MAFSYVDDKGVVKSINDDISILGLAKLIRKEGTTNVYVETNGIIHDKSLPTCLLPNSSRSEDGLMGKINIEQDVDLIVAEDNLNVSVDLDVAEDDLDVSC